MEFFTNRIIVNESKKSFADIISEVTNKGMKKKASVLKQKNNKSGVIKVASITKISKLGDDEAELDIEVEDTEVEDAVDEDTEVEDAVDEDAVDEDDSDEDEMEDDADEESDDDADEELDDDADEESDEDDTEVEDENMDHLELLSNFEKEMGLDKESNEMHSSYADKKEMGLEKETNEMCSSSDEKSASSVQFVKIANLTDKQKSVFRTYWSNIWPKSFIDAVLNTEN
jgi:hypothetical protein